MFRFALSPKNSMHIGDLRVALINYICAKKENSGFAVRIQDADKNRNIDKKDKEMLQILSLFGIKYDKVFYQSDNIKFHQQFGAKLLMDKKAFACFCSENELYKKRESAKRKGIVYKYDGTCEKLSDKEVLENEKPFVLRIKKPADDINFYDEIKGNMSFKSDTIDSFVILRIDKKPTYNFACSIDDMLEDINFIILSEDCILDTLKQEVTRRYLGYNKKIKYAHLPVILKTNGKKISKKDDALSIRWLLEEGFLPEAIANYLLLLGNKTPKKIFSIDEAISWFDVKNISKFPVKFDINKLKELNVEHIKLKDSAKLASLINYSSSKIGELIKFYTRENSTIKEIKEKIDTIFALKNPNSDIKENFKILQKLILESQEFEEFEEFEQYLMRKSGLKGKDFLKTLRFMLTGQENEDKLNELYPYIKDNLQEITRS